MNVTKWDEADHPRADNGQFGEGGGGGGDGGKGGGGKSNGSKVRAAQPKATAHDHEQKAKDIIGNSGGSEKDLSDGDKAKVAEHRAAASEIKAESKPFTARNDNGSYKQTTTGHILPDGRVSVMVDGDEHLYGSKAELASGLKELHGGDTTIQVHEAPKPSGGGGGGGGKPSAASTRVEAAQAKLKEIKAKKPKTVDDLRGHNNDNWKNSNSSEMTKPASKQLATRVENAKQKLAAIRAKKPVGADRQDPANLRTSGAQALARDNPSMTPADHRSAASLSRDATVREAHLGAAQLKEKTQKSAALVPSAGFHYDGPADPSVVFVLCDGVSPTLEERLRAQPLVNEDGVAFAKRYLEPMGLERSEVGVAWCAPGADEMLREHVAKSSALGWVLLGRTIMLDRPEGRTLERVVLQRFTRAGEIWKTSYREEVVRKIKALRKKLDEQAHTNAPSLRPLLKAAQPLEQTGIGNAKRAQIFKALAPKRIVYSVVLDPYQVDTQRDWIPPADIEETAHRFVVNKGYISNRHVAEAPDAVCVESSVEQYPTQDDYVKAMQGLPHRAFRRKFGKDTVHSGAWVMGIKLSPSLWEQYERGEIDAFSIEGLGTRTEVEVSEMPQVTFVDLETVS